MLLLQAKRLFFAKIWYIVAVMVVRMRSTRSHRNNRRSHFSLAAPRVSACEKCGKTRLSHSVCAHCGTYRGRAFADMQARIDKKLKKKARKAKVSGK